METTIKTLNRIYKNFRKSGYNAQQSLRNAKILVKFEPLEYDNKVRIRAEAEQENYFDVYGEPDTKKEKESIINAIESYGCWLVVSEYWDGEEWQIADSIGFCIQNDPCSPYDNCYVPDLMESAIKECEKYLN